MGKLIKVTLHWEGRKRENVEKCGILIKMGKLMSSKWNDIAAFNPQNCYLLIHFSSKYNFCDSHNIVN